MANHESAVKKHRADARRRLRNRNHISRLRTHVKKFREAIDSGDIAGAKGLLTATLAMVDRTARLGVIHDNTASRTKSRLATAFNKAAAAK